MLGERLGAGHTAEIYAWGDRQVIKWFYTGYPKESIERECQHAMLLQQTNWATLTCYGLHLHKDRWGILYERIDGGSLLDDIQAAIQSGTAMQKGEQAVEWLANLHLDMLLEESSDPGYRRLKAQWSQQLRKGPLPLDVRKYVERIADDLPDGDTVCHGDFHFGNVMIQGSDGAKTQAQTQPFIIIDYMNVCLAHRLADIARTFYLIAWTPVPPDFPDPKSVAQMKLALAERYLAQMQIDYDTIKPWLIVVAAARLEELGEEHQLEKQGIVQLLHDWQVWPL